MTITLFDSAIYGAVFADPPIRELLSDARRIKAMAEVEGALAKVLAEMGIIPQSAGAEIRRAAKSLDLAPQDLAECMAENGIPVTGLIAALKERVNPEIGQFVHYGATSQDIVDSAQVLILKDCLVLIRARLGHLIERLAHLMQAHGTTMMAGRTRGQQAVPISFGLKVATWLAPLIRHLERLEQLLPRLLVVQFGGAAGSLAPFGEAGGRVMAALARELDLGAPDLPWHSQRDGIGEFAAWLALLAGALGKIGGDLVALAQVEVGEITVAGGRSSAMPQKANPIGPETLVAGAQLTRDALAGVLAGLAHGHERGGPQLIAEWASLPQMILVTAANLDLSARIFRDLEVQRGRMVQNLAANSGILAEAATFALAKHLGLAEARLRVGQAIASQNEADGRDLLDILAEQSGEPIDWTALRDPANTLGSAAEFIANVAAHAKTILAQP